MIEHFSIVLARKPLSESSIALNVLKWGTGGINIDGSRVGFKNEADKEQAKPQGKITTGTKENVRFQYTDDKTRIELEDKQSDLGRFPANIIFDKESGKILDEQSGISSGTGKSKLTPSNHSNTETKYQYSKNKNQFSINDKGGASRYFYCPKDDDELDIQNTNNMNIDLRLGDCLEVLKNIPDNSIDSIVTDPPYGLGFMNKEWDSPEKLRQLTEREADRSAERKAEGKSPTEAPFSKSVPPGLAIKGAKEGRWFQEWCELWAAECLRVLKPGGHIISFSAPRTYHRMATAFEDAGFEIRDQLMWVFGSGFPKSLNVGKAIDKLQGNEREVIGDNPYNKVRGVGSIENKWKTMQGKSIISKGNSEWEGFGTALKPAHEPMVLGRKPLSEKSVAENVLKWGTGGLNIDGSRIGTDEINIIGGGGGEGTGWGKKNEINEIREGRFPANIIFDEEAGQLLDEQSGISKSGKNKIEKGTGGIWNKGTNLPIGPEYGDKGGASRFFYCPKASKKDRNEGLEKIEKKEAPITNFQSDKGVQYRMENGEITGPKAPPSKQQNIHPTVKPTDLMRYLIKLVTPIGGTTLDPFMGSGSTGKGAMRCGVHFIGIEKEQEYMDIAQARIDYEKTKPVQQKLFDA